MPIRPLSAGKKTGGKRKGKKSVIDEEVIDIRQEQIDRLTREQEEIRSKLNMICSKIIENINIDEYENNIDLTKQQPSDISLDCLLSMVDEMCYYRTAFLNLVQETDDKQKLPIQDKITQLSIEEPQLFRKCLSSNQRLTFVARERDLWKENAQLLQIMYATIVDQLEMGMFQKKIPTTNEILQAHRLNLEDSCLLFLAPNNRSLMERRRKKKLNESEDQPVISVANNENISKPISPLDSNEIPEQPAKNKRRVSFADKVNIIFHNEPSIDEDESHRPLASDILIDKMDSNLRMLIIKELSKDNYIQRPLSKMSSLYGTNLNTYQQQNRSPIWVDFARLIGINESEIEHWLSQSLQYPAGRVISTWCNCTSPPPTVAELYSIISSNKLNRLDLAHSIETMYSI
ncbi:unnamed protein product [Adineta steineri]|uniref:Death domain-containing protein n=3 Tax=Adineta steineri TaxID=433720 RepID=A0A815BGD7_9BILA|nr:unnamed protein product [Adineta steineri]